MITDYDCWHPEHDSVTVAQIIETLNQNAENAQNVLRQAVKRDARRALLQMRRRAAHALITDPKVVPAATKKKLAAIIGKYLS